MNSTDCMPTACGWVQDGLVDFSELAASLLDWQQFQAVEQEWDSWLERVFDRLDTDKNGYVDLQEIMSCAPDPHHACPARGRGVWSSAAPRAL